LQIVSCSGDARGNPKKENLFAAREPVRESQYCSGKHDRGGVILCHPKGFSREKSLDWQGNGILSYKIHLYVNRNVVVLATILCDRLR